MDLHRRKRAKSSHNDFKHKYNALKELHASSLAVQDELLKKYKKSLELNMHILQEINKNHRYANLRKSLKFDQQLLLDAQLMQTRTPTVICNDDSDDDSEATASTADIHGEGYDSETDELDDDRRDDDYRNEITEGSRGLPSYTFNSSRMAKVAQAAIPISEERDLNSRPPRRDMSKAQTIKLIEQRSNVSKELAVKLYEAIIASALEVCKSFIDVCPEKANSTWASLLESDRLSMLEDVANRSIEKAKLLSWIRECEGYYPVAVLTNRRWNRQSFRLRS